jgi:hypothetical protein
MLAEPPFNVFIGIFVGRSRARFGERERALRAAKTGG